MTKDDFAGSIKKYEGQMYRFALSIVRNETDTESAFENEYYMTDFELKQLVMSLPAEFREVVILYYYERFTIKEISQILEVSGGTVKSRLSRAREKLRLLL